MCVLNLCCSFARSTYYACTCLRCLFPPPAIYIRRKLLHLSAQRATHAAIGSTTTATVTANETRQDDESCRAESSRGATTRHDTTRRAYLTRRVVCTAAANFAAYALCARMCVCVCVWFRYSRMLRLHIRIDLGSHTCNVASLPGNASLAAGAGLCVCVCLFVSVLLLSRVDSAANARSSVESGVRAKKHATKYCTHTHLEQHTCICIFLLLPFSRRKV